MPRPACRAAADPHEPYFKHFGKFFGAQKRGQQKQSQVPNVKDFNSIIIICNLADTEKNADDRPAGRMRNKLVFLQRRFFLSFFAFAPRYVRKFFYFASFYILNYAYAALTCILIRSSTNELYISLSIITILPNSLSHSYLLSPYLTLSFFPFVFFAGLHCCWCLYLASSIC